jgi:hypothetical protein
MQLAKQSGVSLEHSRSIRVKVCEKVWRGILTTQLVLDKYRIRR